jgi:hypothetical protein
MALYRSESGKMTGAACLLGQPLKMGTNYKEVALAAASTDIPVGVATQAAAQNSNVGFATGGGTVKALAGAAITKGVLVTAATGGEFITCTKGGTQTETNFCWGSAFSAAGADQDLFELLFNWFEMEIT